MYKNVWSKSGFFLGLLLILSNAGNAQKLSLKTVIDTNRILIGDQIKLTYYLEQGKNVFVKFPSFTQDLTEGIEIINTPKVDSSQTEDGNWKISLELLITSFDTGIYYIPPQKFIRIEDLYSDTVMSSATYLEVFGVAIDTTNTIRAIKPIARMPITIGEILLLISAIIVFSALAYFLYRFFKKRRRKESFTIREKPEEPPDITAFRELDKLKVQKLWQQNKVKEYYTRITYIIRWYIFKRFHIHALEETSEEILYYIKSLNLDDLNLKNLESLLNLADLVKFAKGEPNPDENIIHLDNAYDFIEKTKQKESRKLTKAEDENKEG